MQMDLMREGGGGVRLRPVKAAQRHMKPKEKERFDERVHEPLPRNDFDAAALLDFSKSFQSEWIKLTVNGVISWCCEAKKYIYIHFTAAFLTDEACREKVLLGLTL